jgi:hypothetical protein
MVVLHDLALLSMQFVVPLLALVTVLLDLEVPEGVLLSVPVDGSLLLSDLNRTLFVGLELLLVLSTLAFGV